MKSKRLSLMRTQVISKGEGGKVIECCIECSGVRPGRVIVLMGLAHVETDSLQRSPNLAGIGNVA